MRGEARSRATNERFVSPRPGAGPGVPLRGVQHAVSSCLEGARTPGPDRGPAGWEASGGEARRGEPRRLWRGRKGGAGGGAAEERAEKSQRAPRRPGCPPLPGGRRREEERRGAEDSRAEPGGLAPLRARPSVRPSVACAGEPAAALPSRRPRRSLLSGAWVGRLVPSAARPRRSALGQPRRRPGPCVDMTELQSALLLRRQLAELNKNPVEGFSAGLIDDNDLYRWEVLIIGPPDTLYEGGVFKAHLTFPKDYPLRPPKMKFITEIWHPNVDKNGDVCISILHEPGEDKYGYEKPEERWLPIHTVETIMISVISMLADPNGDSPANVDAAKEWREDRNGEFKRKVARCVRKSQETAFE